jgi:hypothetical protein
MKGYNYLRYSTKLIDCIKIENEVCNGGPDVWNPMPSLFTCEKPCKIITYTGSVVEYSYYNDTDDEASFSFEADTVIKLGKELLVYDTNDMIGSIGGSLGLYLGFSFFGIASTFIDKLLEIWIKMKQNNGIQLR